MAKTFTQKIGDFNTKVADAFTPDLGIKAKIAERDGVADPRTKKVELRSVFPDMKTWNEVMEYLYKN